MQKIKPLLGLVLNGSIAMRKGEVICQVNTKEFGASNNLHLGPINAQWWVVPLGRPEFKDHFFGLVEPAGLQVAVCPSESPVPRSIESCSGLASSALHLSVGEQKCLTGKVNLMECSVGGRQVS